MIVPVKETDAILRANHYLGPTKMARFAWLDRYGAAVLAAPRSRRLPADWLELVRWCLVGGPNAGSQQWRSIVAHLKRAHPNCSTVVSYSDPSEGHTGSLYRACNWLWAPTWLRLRTPPTGNGNWGKEKKQAAKDRWIYIISPDARREKSLLLNDKSLMRRIPWASYHEPTWKRGRFDPRSGGGDYRRWLEMTKWWENRGRSPDAMAIPHADPDPLTMQQVLAALWRYRVRNKFGGYEVPLRTLAREVGVDPDYLSKGMRYNKLSAGATAKLSWLIKQIDAEKVHFEWKPLPHGGGRYCLCLGPRPITLRKESKYIRRKYRCRGTSAASTKSAGSSTP